MEQELTNINCSKCNKKIRPPFRVCSSIHVICPHCQNHCGVHCEEINQENSCEGIEIEFDFINETFKNLLDYCQYDCGYLGSLLKLESHEASCERRSQLVSCHINNCKWIGVPEALITHVDTNHPNQMIAHCYQAFGVFPIWLNNPISLISMFDKKHFYNELYWLRIYEDVDVRYIMVQHIGHAGPHIEPIQKLDSFKITSIENNLQVIKGDVEKISEDSNKTIMDEEYMKNFGTDISFLDGNKYYVELIDSRMASLPSFVLSALECNVCTEIMQEPIKICVNGHSICGNCGQKMKDCPFCRGVISGRNFSLEQIANSISTSCHCKHPSCDKRGSLCRFKINCPYRDCMFQGVSIDLINHWEETHGEVRKNGITYSETIYYNEDGGKAKPRLYAAFNNAFRFTQIFQPPDEFKFSFNQMTLTPSNYNFDINFFNNTNGLSVRFCLPCGICPFGLMFQKIPSDIFYKYICEDDKYNVKINVYKK